MSTPRDRPRRRRTTQQVRELVLNAAGELFAERGYDATTTRAIAERAEVSEQVLFNQFRSKEALFEATVLEPFDRFAREHIEAWNSVPITDLDPQQMLASYIADLYRFVIQHKPLFQALGEARFGPPVERILERLDAVSEQMAALHGYTFDTSVGVRIVFSATTSIALHRASLLPAHTEDAVIAELSSALVVGLLRKAEWST